MPSILSTRVAPAADGEPRVGAAEIGFDALVATYPAKSCFVFSKRNRLRRACVLVSHNKIFDNFIFFVILCNCVTLALTNTRDGFDDTEMGKALAITDNVFIAIFTLEMALKIISMGFVLDTGTYLRDGWNVLDFTIVIMSYVSLLAPANMTGIRTIRALRPLRTINKVKGMKVLVNTVIGSLPMLLDVFWLCALTFFVFGIMAVQLFAGLLRYRCGEPDFTGAYNVTRDDGRLELYNVTYTVPNDQAETTCSGPLSSEVVWSLVDGQPVAAPGSNYVGRVCPDGMYCTIYGNPYDGLVSYDNILWSWLTIFQVITLSGWTDFMYLVVDAVNYWVWLLFVALVILGGFFMINLALAVLSLNFSSANTKAREEDTAEDGQQQQQQEKEGESGKRERPAQELGEAELAKAEGATTTRRGSGDDGSASGPPPAHYGVVRRVVWRVAASRVLEVTTAALIVVNTLVMCINWYGMSDSVEQATNYTNYGLTGYFLGELVVRVAAVGVARFFTNGMNVFDFVVVTVSVVEVVLDLVLSGVGPLSVLRTFRLLRVFRLARHWGALNAILSGMFRSIKSSVMLVVLLLLFIFIAALVGMQLFGYKFMFCDYVEGASAVCPLGQEVWGQCPNHFYCYLPCTADQYDSWIDAPGSFYNGLAYCQRFCALAEAAAAAAASNSSDASVGAAATAVVAAADGCEYLAMVGKSAVPRTQFDGVFWAMFSVFQVITGDGWNDVMYNSMLSVSDWASLYYIIVIVIGNYLVFNLFIAILLDNLNCKLDDKEEQEQEGGNGEGKDGPGPGAQGTAAKGGNGDGGGGRGSRGGSEGGSPSQADDDNPPWGKAPKHHPANLPADQQGAGPKLAPEDSSDGGSAAAGKGTALDGALGPNSTARAEALRGAEVGGGMDPLLSTKTAAAPAAESSTGEEGPRASAPLGSPRGPPEPGALGGHGDRSAWRPQLPPVSTTAAAGAGAGAGSPRASSAAAMVAAPTPPAEPSGTEAEVAGPGGRGPGGGPVAEARESVGGEEQQQLQLQGDDNKPDEAAEPVGGLRQSPPQAAAGGAPEGRLGPLPPLRNHAGQGAHLGGGEAAAGVAAGDRAGSRHGSQSGSRSVSRPGSGGGSGAEGGGQPGGPLHVRFDASPTINRVPSGAVRESAGGAAWAASPFASAGAANLTAADSTTAASGLGTRTESAPSMMSTARSEPSVPRLPRQLSRGGGLASLKALRLARPPPPPRPAWEADLHGRSLLLFPPTSRTRHWAARMVFNPAFEWVILVLILASCVCLVLDSPSLDPQSTMATVLEYLDYVFTAAFTIEAILKIVTFGFALTGPAAYVRDGWNVLDLAIVMVGYTLIIVDAAGADASNVKMLRVLRALRALRPLRAVRRFDGLRLVVNTLFAVLPAMANVALVCVFFYLIFAILSVNLFKGKLFNCVDVVSGSRLDPFYVVAPGQEVTREWCEAGTVNVTSNAYYATWGVTTPEFQLEVEWVNPPSTFDHVGVAMLTLFQAATLSWVDITFLGVDAVGVDRQPLWNHTPLMILYFIFFIIICSFLVLNLFVGVTLEKFTELHEAAHPRSMLLTPEQQRWVDTQLLLLRTELQYRPPRPKEEGVRQTLYDMVTSRGFDAVVMAVIAVNVLFMAMVHADMSKEWQDAMTWSNLAFTAFFAVEALLKVAALGPLGYLRSGWNCFDLFVVAVSVASVVLDLSNTESLTFMPALRVLRVVRIFRLIRSAKGIQMLLRTLISSLPALANVGGIMLVFFFIFAVIGVNLFYGIKQGDTLNDHTNFDNFANAMLTLFSMVTGDGWNGLMLDCMNTAECILVTTAVNITTSDPITTTTTTLPAGTWLDPNDPMLPSLPPGSTESHCPLSRAAAVVYFPTFMILCTFILLNLVIGVLLENLIEAGADEELPIPKAALDSFVEAWAEADSSASGVVHASLLMRVLMRAEPPLGVSGQLNPRQVAQQRLFRLDIPLYEDNMVSFIDTLHMLSGSVAAVPLPPSEQDKVYSELSARVPPGQPHDTYTAAHYHAADSVRAAIRGFLLRYQIRDHIRQPAIDHMLSERKMRRSTTAAPDPSQAPPATSPSFSANLGWAALTATRRGLPPLPPIRRVDSSMIVNGHRLGDLQRELADGSMNTPPAPTRLAPRTPLPPILPRPQPGPKVGASGGEGQAGWGARRPPPSVPPLPPMPPRAPSASAASRRSGVRLPPIRTTGAGPGPRVGPGAEAGAGPGSDAPVAAPLPP